MLGMSLFNFGAAWGKFRSGQLPKRTRHIRTRQQEQLDSSVQSIASIAEEEAQVVVATQEFQRQESQQQVSEEASTVFQKTMRFLAVATWAFAASVLFTSVVFNYPLGLGKGLLSLLPGQPHIASVVMESDKRIYRVGDEVEVAAKLNTRGENAKMVKLVVNYDSNSLNFRKHRIERKYFPHEREFAVDKKRGKIEISLQSLGDGIAVGDEPIAHFEFETVSPKQKCMVNPIWEESQISKQDEEMKNILGKVSGVRFRIYGP